MSRRMRTLTKRLLGAAASRTPAAGTSVLIYHRVGGGTPDERDLALASFSEQLDLLDPARVVSLDDALDELAAGDDSGKVVLTFDDGFADVYTTAFPLLKERGLPFMLYLATAYVGGRMHWDGSTASAPGPALDWDQISEMVSTGLCQVGNHTHAHVPPALLSFEELDGCSAEIERHLGSAPRHFAYPWGVAVPGMEATLRARFRSAATGELGRNHPATDPLRLRRIPVRQTDPAPFFAAKLTGRLLPERAYARLAAAAKNVRGR